MEANLFNTFHFMVLHFPIALLILSFILDLIAAIWRKSGWHDPMHKAGFLLLLFGVLTSIVTVVSGFIAANQLGVGGKILTHASKAVMVTSYATVLAFIRAYFVWSRKKDITDNIFYLIAAFVGILLVWTQFKVYRFSHFALLQFTVPLLISGFLADLASLIWRKKDWAEELRRMGYYFLVLGTVAIIGTVITGYMRAAALPDLTPPRPYDPEAIGPHELWGMITMIFFILLAAVRSFFLFKKKEKAASTGSAVYVVSLVAGLIVISWASHLGGNIVLFPALFG